MAKAKEVHVAADENAAPTPQVEVAAAAPQEAPAAPEAPAAETPREYWHPVETLRREVDRLFEDFRSGSWRFPFSLPTFEREPFWQSEIKVGAVPNVDIVEKDTAYEIKAELPGLEAGDVGVAFANGALTIRGEKREESEETRKGYFVSERRYGSFQRSFRVPEGIDEDRIEAMFRNGVLTILLPKAAEPQKAEKTIPIKAA